MMKKTFLASILSLLIFFMGAVLVFATSHVPPQGGGINTPQGGGTNPSINVTIKNPFSGANSLFDLLKKVVNDILLPIGGVLAVLAFIYSGFLYVTAQGNETKLATAHKALLYTAIGTAVLLGSWVLANVICNTIGKLGVIPICPTP
jgi:SNF family Na+-dependent transporter